MQHLRLHATARPHHAACSNDRKQASSTQCNFRGASRGCGIAGVTGHRHRSRPAQRLRADLRTWWMPTRYWMPSWRVWLARSTELDIGTLQ